MVTETLKRNALQMTDESPQEKGLSELPKSVHSCELCCLDFSTKEEFQEHEWSLNHHQRLDKKHGRNYVHGCGLCKDNFFGLLAFVKHIQGEAHNKALKTRNYEKEYKTPPLISRHEKFGHGRPGTRGQRARVFEKPRLGWEQREVFPRPPLQKQFGNHVRRPLHAQPRWTQSKFSWHRPPPSHYNNVGIPRAYPPPIRNFKGESLLPCPSVLMEMQYRQQGRPSLLGDPPPFNMFLSHSMAPTINSHTSQEEEISDNPQQEMARTSVGNECKVSPEMNPLASKISWSEFEFVSSSVSSGTAISSSSVSLKKQHMNGDKASSSSVALVPRAASSISNRVETKGHFGGISSLSCCRSVDGNNSPLPDSQHCDKETKKIRKEPLASTAAVHGPVQTPSWDSDAAVASGDQPEDSPSELNKQRKVQQSDSSHSSGLVVTDGKKFSTHDTNELDTDMQLNSNLSERRSDQQGKMGRVTSMGGQNILTTETWCHEKPKGTVGRHFALPKPLISTGMLFGGVRPSSEWGQHSRGHSTEDAVPEMRNKNVGQGRNFSLDFGSEFSRMSRRSTHELSEMPGVDAPVGFSTVRQEKEPEMKTSQNKGLDCKTKLGEAMRTYLRWKSAKQRECLTLGNFASKAHSETMSFSPLSNSSFICVSQNTDSCSESKAQYSTSVPTFKASSSGLMLLNKQNVQCTESKATPLLPTLQKNVLLNSNLSAVKLERCTSDGGIKSTQRLGYDGAFSCRSCAEIASDTTNQTANLDLNSSITQGFDLDAETETKSGKDEKDMFCSSTTRRRFETNSSDETRYATEKDCDPCSQKDDARFDRRCDRHQDTRVKVECSAEDHSDSARLTLDPWNSEHRPCYSSIDNSHSPTLEPGAPSSDHEGFSLDRHTQCANFKEHQDSNASSMQAYIPLREQAEPAKSAVDMESGKHTFVNVFCTCEGPMATFAEDVENLKRSTGFDSSYVELPESEHSRIKEEEGESVPDVAVSTASLLSMHLTLTNPKLREKPITNSKGFMTDNMSSSLARFQEKSLMVTDNGTNTSSTTVITPRRASTDASYLPASQNTSDCVKEQGLTERKNVENDIALKVTIQNCGRGTKTKEFAKPWKTDRVVTIADTKSNFSLRIPRGPQKPTLSSKDGNRRCYANSGNTNLPETGGKIGVQNKSTEKGKQYVDEGIAETVCEKDSSDSPKESVSRCSKSRDMLNSSIEVSPLKDKEKIAKHKVDWRLKMEEKCDHSVTVTRDQSSEVGFSSKSVDDGQAKIAHVMPQLTQGTAKTQIIPQRKNVKKLIKRLKETVQCLSQESKTQGSSKSNESRLNRSLSTDQFGGNTPESKPVNEDSNVSQHFITQGNKVSELQRVEEEKREKLARSLQLRINRFNAYNVGSWRRLSSSEDESAMKAPHNVGDVKPKFAEAPSVNGTEERRDSAYIDRTSIRHQESRTLQSSAKNKRKSDKTLTDSRVKRMEPKKKQRRTGKKRLVQVEEPMVVENAEKACRLAQKKKGKCFKKRERLKRDAFVGSDLTQHFRAVTCVKTFGHYLFSASVDGSVRILNRKTGQTVKCLKEASSINCLEIAIVNDEPFLLYGGDGLQLIKRHLKNLKTHTIFQFDSRITAIHVAFGNLYVGMADGTLSILSATEATVLKDNIQCHFGDPCMLTHLASANYKSKHQIILTAGYDKKITYREAKTGECLRLVDYHRDYVLCLQVKKNWVFSSSLDCSLVAHSLGSGELLQAYPAHPRGITVFKTVGSVVVTCCLDGLIRCFDKKGGNLMQVYVVRNGQPFCFHIADNLVGYVGTGDGRINAFKLNLCKYWMCQWKRCGLPIGSKDHLQSHLENHLANEVLNCDMSLGFNPKCQWLECAKVFSYEYDEKDILTHARSHVSRAQGHHKKTKLEKQINKIEGAKEDDKLSETRS